MKFIRYSMIIVLASSLLACKKNEKTMDYETGTEASVQSDNELILPDFAQYLPATMKRMHTDKEYMQLVNTLHKIEPRLLLLVDKQHSLPDASIPPDLISLDDYADPLLLNRKSMEVSALMINDLLAMVQAARTENIELPISSAYRSYDYQNMLFERAVERSGRQQALRESAEPGKSQHQLGLALDFGSITPAFADTDAGKWLAEHAGRYGFSLSYPPHREDITGYMYESWHYRYIGREACDIQKTFFADVQQYMLEFWHNYKNAQHNTGENL